MRETLELLIECEQEARAKAEMFNKVADSIATARHAIEGVKDPAPNGGEAILARLSAREHETFMLMAEGKPLRQIALEMGVSKRTVEGFKAKIKSKLRLANANELVIFASRFKGLLKE